MACEVFKIVEGVGCQLGPQHPRVSGGAVSIRLQGKFNAFGDFCQPLGEMPVDPSFL